MEMKMMRKKIVGEGKRVDFVNQAMWWLMKFLTQEAPRLRFGRGNNGYSRTLLPNFPNGRPRSLLVKSLLPKAYENHAGDHYHLKSTKNKINYYRLYDIEIFYNKTHLDSEMVGLWAKLPLIRKLLLSHLEVCLQMKMVKPLIFKTNTMLIFIIITIKKVNKKRMSPIIYCKEGSPRKWSHEGQIGLEQRPVLVDLDLAIYGFMKTDLNHELFLDVWRIENGQVKFVWEAQKIVDPDEVELVKGEEGNMVDKCAEIEEGSYRDNHGTFNLKLVTLDLRQQLVSKVLEIRIVIIAGIYALSERLRPLLDLRSSVTRGCSSSWRPNDFKMLKAGSHWKTLWFIDKVVDLATVTGACVVVIGNDIAGMFTPNDEIAEEISKASKIKREKFWRMPLEEATQKSRNQG
eukprot:Gb_13278 [translate_table: standard]